MWNQIILGNPITAWLSALGLFLGVLVIGKLLFSFGLKHLTKISRATSWRGDDFLVEVLQANTKLLFMGLGIFAALQFLHLSPRVQSYTENLMVVILILQAGLWGHKAVDVWLQWRFAITNVAEQGGSIMTLGLLSFLGKLLLWVVVVLLALDNLGLNITALVASLGIGGVAVALAPSGDAAPASA